MALDSQIKNLALAIRQQESGGNYDTKGGSGEYGAYQFMPDTWNGLSKKYLGSDVPLKQATPNQQNQVAYNYLKELAGKGYKPSQIAAVWNAGEGSLENDKWKTNVGTNSFGVKYDTPSYVSNVGKYYKEYSNGTATSDGTTSTTPPTDTPPPQSIGSKILGLAGTVTGTEGAGQDIGGAMAAGGNQELLDQAEAQHEQIASNLVNTIQQKEKFGLDTSKLKTALQQLIESSPKLNDFIPDAAKKTTAQLVADFGQLGLAVGAGAIPGGGSVAGRILGAGAVGGAMGATNAVQEGKTDAESIGTEGAIGAVAGAATGGLIEGAVAGVKSLLPAPEIERITNAIAPKETAAEARLAMKQGRMTAAKEPGLFSSGTPGEITPTAKVQQAAQTIHEQIPGAAKMDEPTLFNALDNKIGETAQALRPQMEAVKVEPSALHKIVSEWENLKAEQLDGALKTEEPNIQKYQSKFEERLLKINSNSSLAEVWDARVDYDNSVSTNVKKATSMSSDSMQAAKKTWLQNRALMNGIINDMGTGLGETSQKAFSSMSDMYTAQNGIMTKAKDSLKAKPSKLVQFFKRHPVIGKAVSAAASAAGIDYGLKKVGILK